MLHVTTQSQVPLPLIFLSYYTFTVRPTLHQTHTCSNSQRFNPWLSHFLTLWPPHLEQSTPRHRALCYSFFLQKQTQDISLLRIFQLSNIVHHPYQSVQCVCVCVFVVCVCVWYVCVCVVCVCVCVWVCVCVHLLHSYTWTLVYIMS